MKTVPLDSLADIQLGKMLSPASKTGRNSFPYLRNQNVQWHRLELKDLATMDFSEKERAKFELKPGDLLVCEGGEPGRCAVWNGEIENCYYQKAIHRVRPKVGLADPTFLSYWLWYQCKYGDLSVERARTTIAHLPSNQINQLQVPDLPLHAQQEVARQVERPLQLAEVGVGAARMQLAELSALAVSVVRLSLTSAMASEHSLGDVLIETKEGIGARWREFPVFGATRVGLAPAKEVPGKHAERYKPVTCGAIFYNPMRILIGSSLFRFRLVPLRQRRLDRSRNGLVERCENATHEMARLAGLQGRLAVGADRRTLRRTTPPAGRPHHR